MTTLGILIRLTIYISFGDGSKLIIKIIQRKLIKNNIKELNCLMAANIRLILMILVKLSQKLMPIKIILNKCWLAKNLNNKSRKSIYHKCTKDLRFTTNSCIWSSKPLFKDRTTSNWLVPTLSEETKAQHLNQFLKISWFTINIIVERKQMSRCLIN